MIRRKISRTRRSAYQEWWDQVGEAFTAKFKEAQEQGDKGSKSRPGSWIDKKNRSKLRFFITEDGKKCAYCERIPNDGGGDLEIDHFLPKSLYPEMVVTLCNLIPACKQCNTIKSRIDPTGDRAMIHPFKDNPQKHLVMDPKSLEIGHITDPGKHTVEALENSLNTSKYISTNKNGKKVEEKGALFTRKQINEILEQYMKFIGDSGNDPEKISRNLLDILKMVSPEKSMTATWASLICSSPKIQALMDQLNRLDPELGKKIGTRFKEAQKYSLYRPEAGQV